MGLNIKTSSEIFKALGDKTRFKIITLLSENHYCVGALASKLNTSQASVSQHLQVLRKAEVVWGEKRGYWTHYMINKEVLEAAGIELQELALKANSHSSPCTSHENTTKKCSLERSEVEMYKPECKHPEQLQKNPQGCTPEQIRKCHGEERSHSCEEEKEKNEEE